MRSRSGVAGLLAPPTAEYSGAVNGGVKTSLLTCSLRGPASSPDVESVRPNRRAATKSDIHLAGEQRGKAIVSSLVSLFDNAGACRVTSSRRRNLLVENVIDGIEAAD